MTGENPMLGWMLLLVACSKGPVASDEALPSDTADTDVVARPLADVVGADALRPHLEAFAAFGEAHGDTRAWGTEGHAASADYAAGVLADSGFAVEVRTSSYRTWDLDGSALEQVAPEPATFREGEAYLVLGYSGEGDVTAAVTAVDVMVPPGSQANTSTSGCEAADFAGFPAGNVALLQRGSCTFAEKVANAEAAGAVAVVVFNEGQSGRTGLVEGSLDSLSPATIPVVGVGYAVGVELVALAAAGELELRVAVDVSDDGVPVHNVVAELPGADPERWLWLGAHLDSVEAGPGINDNGSGSALLLAIAEAVHEVGLSPEIGLRLTLWDGEEHGLWGSSAHVAEAGVGGTVAYLNFDMIGSPNGGTFVYDGDGSNEGLDFGSADAFPLVEGMDVLEGAFRDVFAAADHEVSEVSRDCPTDSLVFLAAGVPVGGIFSGAFHGKTAEEAAAWGGTAGVAHDACYHQACDGLPNLSEPLLDAHSRASAEVTDALLRGELDLGAPAASRSAIERLPRMILPHGHEVAPRVQPVR
jgi:Zn-dependent M28 family amino/carboxypeptidase